MQKNKSVAMLGGTFDPIHKGHLFLLENAIRQTSYDCFILVPAHLSNFKQSSEPSASDSQRLEMTRLAIEDFRSLYNFNTEIIVSDVEIQRKGVSYTYDTVVSLKKEYDIDGRLGLLMGDDHVANLEKWYRFEDLKDQVEFLICRRGKTSCWEELPKDLMFKQIFSEGLSPESSTEFRENPLKHEYFLTPRVLDYIKRNNLYV